MAHQEITTNQCRPLSLAEPHAGEPFACTQLGRLAAASARALRIEASDFDAGRSSTTSTPATGHRTGSPTARPTRILTTPAPPHSTSAPTTSTPPWPGSGATQRSIQASQGNRPRLLPRPAADLTPPTRARASLTLPVGIAVTPARTRRRRPDRHLADAAGGPPAPQPGSATASPVPGEQNGQAPARQHRRLPGHPAPRHRAHRRPHHTVPERHPVQPRGARHGQAHRRHRTRRRHRLPLRPAPENRPQPGRRAPKTADAIVAENGNVRLGGLRASLPVLAIITLIAPLSSSQIPMERPAQPQPARPRHDSHPSGEPAPARRAGKTPAAGTRLDHGRRNPATTPCLPVPSEHLRPGPASSASPRRRCGADIRTHSPPMR